MLDIILIAIAAVVIMFVIIVALQPPRSYVTRSAVIAAPVSAVFTQVNEFRNWLNWSPWLKLDPDVQIKFEGPPAGEGAIYRWRGNRQIGAGNMKILASIPDEVIRIRLEFERPYPGVSTTEFSFKPVEDKTRITWTMISNTNFITRAVLLIVNMDRMVGLQFEAGLENMRSVLERQ